VGIAPFELHNAHVYVRVQVAEAVSGWFILDTGASTTIDSATIMPLGLPVVRTETGSGGGEAAFIVRHVGGVQLRLLDAAGQPVAALPAQRVATLDLSPVARGEGRPLAGVLGGSFFAHYAVKIDYERRQIEVHPRRGFRAPSGWIAVPLRVQGDLASARGAVTLRSGERAIPGWYHIDTGGAHTLILNTPFVSRHALAAPETTSPAAMHGLGGGAPAQPGRVAAFGVGGVTITDVAALFSQARSGFFSSDALDGSVGGALLTGFSGVAFDYASRRMWLGPVRPAP
jgi:hypothetical protein